MTLSNKTHVIVFLLFSSVLIAQFKSSYEDRIKNLINNRYPRIHITKVVIIKDGTLNNAGILVANIEFIENNERKKKLIPFAVGHYDSDSEEYYVVPISDPFPEQTKTWMERVFEEKAREISNIIISAIQPWENLDYESRLRNYFDSVLKLEILTLKPVLIAKMTFQHGALYYEDAIIEFHCSPYDGEITRFYNFASHETFRLAGTTWYLNETQIKFLDDEIFEEKRYYRSSRTNEIDSTVKRGNYSIKGENGKNLDSLRVASKIVQSYYWVSLKGGYGSYIWGEYALTDAHSLDRSGGGSHLQFETKGLKKSFLDNRAKFLE